MKQNHNNTRLNDAQFADAILGIRKLWTLLQGNFSPDPAHPEVKLGIAGFNLRPDHGVAVKTLEFFENVKSETNQESARRNAPEVKQALLGLLRSFLGNHVTFFDKEMAAAFAGVNRYLKQEYSQGSEKLFNLIQITKWEDGLNSRIEKRRAELEAGKTTLGACQEAEDFVPFITLQNQTLVFMKAVYEEMKRAAGNRAAAKITEAAKAARRNPEVIGKEPAKKVAPAPKAPAFNPMFADLLADI